MAQDINSLDLPLAQLSLSDSEWSGSGSEWSGSGSEYSSSLTDNEQEIEDLTDDERDREDIFVRTFAPPTVGDEHRYYLPVDDEERDRQAIHNELWNTIGLNVLLTRDCIPPGTYYDLGAGYGFWATETASTLRDHQVIGLDLHFPPGSVQSRENCSFVVGNYEEPFHRPAHPVALVHLRDSYLSLRAPGRLAVNVSNVLCEHGWFWNQETRLENWNTEKPYLDEWRLRTMAAARSLGIPLHSAQDLQTAFLQVGCTGWSAEYHWQASNVTAIGLSLLEFVKLTVRASVRILVTGGPSGSAEVRDLVENVMKELDEDDCTIGMTAEVFVARKPALADYAGRNLKSPAVWSRGSG